MMWTANMLTSLYTNIITTFSKTRQLDDYFDCLARVIPTRKLASGPGLYQPLLSSPCLKKITETVAKTMPFAQTIPTAKKLVNALVGCFDELSRNNRLETLEMTTDKRGGSGSKKRRISGSSKQTGDKSTNDMSTYSFNKTTLETLGLLLVHFVVGAAQSIMSPQQGESWQQCLDETYILVKESIAPVESSNFKELRTWLTLLVHYTWIELSGRLDGDDEWTGKHLELPTLHPLIAIARPSSQFASSRVSALSAYVVFQALAHAQSSTALDIVAITGNVSNISISPREKHSTKDRWREMLAQILWSFCEWYHDNPLDTMDQMGWLPWDGQPHTITDSKFGTAQWHLLADWIEPVSAFSESKISDNIMSLIVPLVLS